MKALCALFVLVPAAFASTITGLDPVPIITTICTVGGSSVGCSISPEQSGTESVAAYGSASIVGLNTANGLNIETIAEAQAGTAGSVFGSLGSSAIATVTLDFFGSTEGPERQGFATYLIYADGDHGGGASGGATSFISGLGSCGNHCDEHGTLVPFELGVPFEIGLSAAAYGQRQEYKHTLDGGSGDAMVRLQLFEADGTPVTIFDPVGPVPEPGTWILLALGMVTLSAFRSRPILGAARRALSR